MYMCMRETITDLGFSRVHTKTVMGA